MMKGITIKLESYSIFLRDKVAIRAYVLSNYGIITYVDPENFQVAINNLIYNVDEDIPDLKYVEGTIARPPHLVIHIQNCLELEE